MGLISTQAKSLSLGGRYTNITHSSIYHILLILCISMFCFLSFVVSCFVLVSQNTKRPKIFLLFLFVTCFLLVSSFSLLGFYFKLHFKNPKTVCFAACFFCSCFKIRKPKNMCCSSSVLQSLLQSATAFRDSIGAWYSFHIIQATSEKQL